MTFRKLRIAWSVGWGVAALFVIIMYPSLDAILDFGDGLDVPFRQDGFHWPTSDELMAGAWGPFWPFVFNHALSSLMISALLALAPWLPCRFSLQAILATIRQHKLRSAWSMVWGILAVSLCVVWYRDWPAYVSGHFPGVSSFHISTWRPLLGSRLSDTVSALVEFGSTAKADSKWQMGGARGGSGAPPEGFSFQLFRGAAGFYAHAPHRFLLSLFTGLAAAPWSFPALPKRFSLRTLLLVTTLVAVVLGLIVWAAR